MALYENIRGTISALWQLGLSRAQFKSTATGELEARNSADSAYAIMRGATPVGADDLTPKFYVDSATAAVASMQLWGNSGLTASTTTRYLSPGCTDDTAHTTITEFRVTRAGTFSKMRVRHNTASGNGNSIVYTLLVNGVASALTVSMASTASDGSDLVNTAAVAVGDLVSLQVTKAAGIASSPSDIVVSTEFDA